MIEGTTPFLERAHKVAIAIGVASLLLGIVWAVVVDDGDSIVTLAANGYSRSTIGFRALGALLEQRGIPIVHSRFRSPQRTTEADLLVLAAPDFDKDEDDRDTKILTAALDGGHRVLLILPKWKSARVKGKAEPSPPFVTRLRRVPDAAVLRPLKSIDDSAAVATATAPDFSLNVFRLKPQATPFQLLQSGGLTPLIAGDDGVLVGEVRRGKGRVVVLSDPDVVANCGLGQGENAALALALVDALRGDGGTVVFDETLHGFERTPSIWREVGRPPLKQGSAHLALLAVAAVLAGAVRFGTPRRVRGGWREGKQALLDNTAELMELVGHFPSAVARYFDATIERLTEALHAPADLDRSARHAWLASRLAPERRREFAELAAAVAPPEGGATGSRPRRSRKTALRELAARIHRFREEVLHGAR